MPLRALIADDEIHLAEHLKSELASLWPELEIVALARTGREAAAQIEALQPDLAFLDIQMPGLTGLEVAEGIEGRTRVVFVTAFDEFACQAFEQAALDYVLKPVKRERLHKTVQRLQDALGAPGAGDADAPALAQALQQLQAPAGGLVPPTAPLRYVRASQGELMHQIPIGEVIYFHADDKYTCVRTAQGEYLIRTPIADLALQLDPQEFWRVHRSTLVNLAHLAGTRRDELSRLFLRFRGLALELPVSRAYVHLFKAM
ncbi:LytTR family DNA-binding domain-containing protein [Pelomonas sp. APW6]|uniref:LytTR family DNA-binding domain-containing protein n=1 Tax=Roseateles subflavus TaxID=3053353 RepID=A0ABT7LQ39_9BURK|nr:LytTR family DNA-binding domain-containing protein [Pelomonas sp. APW6]MDL5034539.1 LytTR family DNA-binding domain-containing protein [Pelomonas sp. APW6]